MQTRVGRVSVRGVEIEYEEAGVGERALVLVHGFTGSRDDFREQLPVLAEHGRTIAIDQRGHGGSSNVGEAAGYTFDELVDDLEAMLEALGVERCDLLGHSLGGMVVLRYALAWPERVASLVLMDTSPGPITMAPAGMRDAALALIRAQGMTGLADVMRKGFGREGVTAPAAIACAERMGADAFHARIRRKLSQMDPVAFEVLGALLADHPSVAHRLGEIGCPALIVLGEQDRPFVEPSHAMEQGLSGARRVVIENAAHSPQLENPDAWQSAVLEHLARVRS